jgi:hypothetical protein
MDTDKEAWHTRTVIVLTGAILAKTPAAVKK